MRRMIIVFLCTILMGLNSCAREPSSATQKDEELVYVGIDGNIYSKKSIESLADQITKDGDSENPYTFAGLPEVWSSDAKHFLAARKGDTFLVNIDTQNVVSLGDWVEYAKWSPDGTKILLSKFNEKTNIDMTDERDFEVDDSNGWVVMPPRGGYAPTWLDDRSVLFFKWSSAREYTYFTDAYRVSLTGSETKLRQSICSFMRPVFYSDLSRNGNYLLFDSGQSGLNLGMTSLNMTNTSCVTWASTYQYDENRIISEVSYAWSPVEPVAVICTDQSNTDRLVPEGSGSILIVKYDQPVIELVDQRCDPFTRISWNSSGDTVAYLNLAQTLSFIDVHKGETLLKKQVPEDIKFDKGPWLSKSGGEIAAISGKDIYIGRIDGNQVIYQVLASGTDFSWR